MKEWDHHHQQQQKPDKSNLLKAEIMLGNENFKKKTYH